FLGCFANCPDPRRNSLEYFRLDFVLSLLVLDRRVR
ncbi:hypothetical protein AB1N83_014214, partial [Pleurotus pulmonarius]